MTHSDTYDMVLEQSEHDREIERDEAWARLQAGDQIEKLEEEVNNCNSCAGQYHKCTQCWDNMTLIAEIKRFYGFK